MNSVHHEWWKISMSLGNKNNVDDKVQINILNQDNLTLFRYYICTHDSDLLVTGEAEGIITDFKKVLSSTAVEELVKDIIEENIVASDIKYRYNIYMGSDHFTAFVFIDED